MKTRITKLLGIRYPILQGGMQWVARSTLVATVSNASGLGVLTELTQPSPEHLRKEIQKTQALTRAPFAVNLTVLPVQNKPPYDEFIDVIIESGIRIVETAGNNPKEYLGRLHQGGVKVIHKCTSVRHALSAQKIGADAVSIDGFECAGHPGEDDVPGLVLIPAAVKVLDIPVVASGAGMAAALALGADGVNMGTRFLATMESPIHDALKQALVNAKETDTQLVLRSLNNTSRALGSSVTQEVVDIERHPGGCQLEDLRHLVTGQRGKAALQSGYIDDAVIATGQCVGLIDDVPTYQELIDSMVRDCRAAFARGTGLFLS